MAENECVQRSLFLINSKDLVGAKRALDDHCRWLQEHGVFDSRKGMLYYAMRKLLDVSYFLRDGPIPGYGFPEVQWSCGFVMELAQDMAQRIGDATGEASCTASMDQVRNCKNASDLERVVRRLAWELNISL